MTEPAQLQPEPFRLKPTGPCPCGARAVDRCLDCFRNLCGDHRLWRPSQAIERAAFNKAGEVNAIRFADSGGTQFVAVCHPACSAPWWSVTSSRPAGGG